MTDGKVTMLCLEGKDEMPAADDEVKDAKGNKEAKAKLEFDDLFTLTDGDGKDRYTTDIVVENIQLLGKRPEDGAAPLAGGQPQGGYQQQRPQQPQQGYAQGGYQGGYQQPAQPAAPAYQQPAAPVQQEAAPSDDLPF